MRFDYDKTTDSLFIKLSEGVYEDSEEIAENFIVDFDKEGRVIGLDIQHASVTMPGFETIFYSGFIGQMKPVSAGATKTAALKTKEFKTISAKADAQSDKPLP